MENKPQKLQEKITKKSVRSNLKTIFDNTLEIIETAVGVSSFFAFLLLIFDLPVVLAHIAFSFDIFPSDKYLRISMVLFSMIIYWCFLIWLWKTKIKDKDS